MGNRLGFPGGNWHISILEVPIYWQGLYLLAIWTPVSALWTVHLHNQSLYSSIFIVPCGFHKLGGFDWNQRWPTQTGFTVLGTKREEVTGDWRELHNEKLHYLYSSQEYLGGACGMYGEAGRWGI
jgi:hypothetical protein